MSAPVELSSPRARALMEQALAEQPSRLDLAALAVAALEAPELDTAAVLQQLDALAERVRALAPSGSAPLTVLTALRRVLADEDGFRGDEDDFHAPKNSSLPSVLERRRGLPITLSVVYLEVARRVDLPLFGVGFPGHFLVALKVGPSRVVVDPFANGEVLNASRLRALLARAAPEAEYSDALITPSPVSAIALRMLNNLKRTYLDQGATEPALRVVNLMLVLTPENPVELQSRAALLSALGAYRAALSDVERCLELPVSDEERGQLQRAARVLKQRLEMLH